MAESREMEVRRRALALGRMEWALAPKEAKDMKDLAAIPLRESLGSLSRVDQPLMRTFRHGEGKARRLRSVS